MKREHLTSLTSLRFFAALGVFLSHLAFLKESEYSYLFVDKGYIGVTFFFILSGFILSYSYSNVKNITLKSFYIARFARIYPLHFITLIISLPFVIYGGWKSILATLPNIFLMQSFIPIKRVYFGANGPSWSISTEMFFYVLFPFIIRLKTNPLVLLSILLIIFQLVIYYLGLPEKYTHAIIYISPFSRVLDFILGVLLYKLTYDKEKCNPNLYQPLSIVIFILFVCASVEYDIPQVFMYDLFFVLPFLLIIYAFSNNKGFISKGLFFKPIVILGEASFAFYLIHQLVIRYLNVIDGKFIPIDVLSRASLALLISLISSVILFYLFEKPMNKHIKKKLR